jgi:hypothetical protein
MPSRRTAARLAGRLHLPAQSNEFSVGAKLPLSI